MKNPNVEWGVAAGLVKLPDANAPQKSATAIKKHLLRFNDSRVGSRKKPSQVGEVRRYIVYPK